MERMNSPYENLLDMYIAEKREGFCKIGIAYRKELTNPHGNFHGGVIASIVDTAVVQSLRTVIPEGPYLTVNLEIRYKNTSSAAEIFAEARPQHLRGKFFRTEVKILDKENKLIAEAWVKSFIPTWKEEK
jgi:uncharacterized protein (TIGR00369 family)